MNNAAAALAARCASLIGEKLREVRAELMDDPEYQECSADPMLVGMILVLCNAVMRQENWTARREVFNAFAGVQWPQGVTVRERLDELLDGVNLRSDFWNQN